MPIRVSLQIHDAGLRTACEAALPSDEFQCAIDDRGAAVVLQDSGPEKGGPATGGAVTGTHPSGLWVRQPTEPRADALAHETADHSRPEVDTDVHLPRDFLPRELQAAVRLTAVIARLRQQERAAQTRAARLHDFAYSDPLTGLPNRRAWEEELQAERPWRGGAGEAVVVFDIDRFKQVNDRRGHAAGDRLLRAVAAGLRAGIRGADFVARLGGDEFGLLLAAIPAPAPQALVERIRRQAQAHASATRDGANGTLRSEGTSDAADSEAITLSAGVALASAATDRHAAWQRADQALLRAKAAGRDRTCLADESDEKPPEERGAN